MASEGATTILVVDDDTSRHDDLRSWILSLGLRADVRDRPPADPATLDTPVAVVIHAGYGRRRPGFPRAERRAEAVHWLLDDPSYLFHEELEAFGALGRWMEPQVPLVVITGGSHRDLPTGQLTRLAAARTLVFWNVIDLMATRSVQEVVSGPEPPDQGRDVDPARVESEVRHDLLNRLWNMALAAGEEAVDVEEIAEIVAGDDDQSTLDVLVEASPDLDARTRDELAGALRRAGGSHVMDGLAALTRRAIEELEDR